MSPFPRKAHRGKVSSSTHFRVSQSPYSTRASVRNTNKSLLTPNRVEEITGRAFDRRTHTLQQSYQTLIESHSAARKQGIEIIRNEVGWTGAFSEGTWEPIDTGEPIDRTTC
ncbi:hypothetical protein RSAG8_13516, partial [Rhizoctonia solani AG-8 WAC10335]